MKLKRLYLASIRLLKFGLVARILLAIKTNLLIKFIPQESPELDKFLIYTSDGVLMIGILIWFYCVTTIIDAIIDAGETEPPKPFNP